MRAWSNPRIRFLIFFLALAVVWFGTLDYRRLIRTDEGRYADIPFEMMVSGDWLTPRLNGINYFEKPPLQYWATALAFKSFGVHEWTARLWSAATGFAGVLLAWFCGTRLFGRPAGDYAAAILGSTALYLLIGQADTLDMGFTFFMELALLGFLLAQHDERHSPRWMLLSWTGLALSVLSKGVVGLVLLGMTLIVYSLATRDRSFWRKLNPVWGIPVFLLIAAPWFIAVSIVNPEFVRFFFVHEHFERFLTKVHHRYGPPWYFIPIFLIGALPWTPFMLTTLCREWSARRAAIFQPMRVLWIWSVVVFVFFSISDSKLPTYILPIFPALALATGNILADIDQKFLVRVLGALGLVALALLSAIPYLSTHMRFEVPPEMIHAYSHWLVASSAIWLLGILMAWGLALRNRISPAIFFLAAFSLTAEMGVLLGHECLNRWTSAYHLASLVKSRIPPEVPVYCVNMYDHTLPVYLQRTLILVEHPDEMAFGLEHEPWKWIPTIDEFKKRWAADPDAFAFMSLEDYVLLGKKGVSMTLIAQDVRLVVARKK